MPLDGHSFLVAQGWAGKGSGLREGAISRPLAIPQKRTLAGVGKDRDEAFPFWDHLFSAAAKTIQLKIHNSDSEEESAEGILNEENPTPVISRTSTGILSNRRPLTGTSAEGSGASTPVEPDCSRPRYSLLVSAKREAARRNLYSMFFRGAVLGPDFGQEFEVPVAPDVLRESQVNSESEGGMAKNMKERSRDVIPSDERQEMKRKLKTGGDESVHKKKKKWQNEEPEIYRRKEVKLSEAKDKHPEKMADCEEERRWSKRRRKEEKKRTRQPGAT